jgi:hypothetical protein
MAKSQTAFLAPDQVPNRSTLQNALKGLRFPLSVDSDYVPFESTGYLPCTLDGEDAGFDIKFEDSATRLLDQPQLQAGIGGQTAAITLRWGGDPRERVAALIVGATLAHSFGAMVQRQGDANFRSVEALVDEARRAVAQLQDE